MLQLLNWRFVAACAALLLLVVAVDGVVGEGDQTGSIAFASSADLDENGEPLRRRIDLIESVDEFALSDDFEVGEDGLTVGVLDAVLDPNRVMRVAPGTPGQITCDNLTSPNRCVVLADLLGEAVVWFAILPKAPSETVELPPIVDLQDGYAVFGNGWEILYPPTIERDSETCNDFDIPSFSDFLRRFGPNSTSIVDLETQQVVAVECGEEYVAPTTTVVFDGSLDAAIVTAPSTTIDVADPEVVAPEN